MEACNRDQSYSPDPPLLLQPVPTNPSELNPECMILDQGKLTEAERIHRLNRGMCLYCGKVGDFRAVCPTHPTHLMMNAIHAIQENMPPLTTVLTLTAPNVSIPGAQLPPHRPWDCAIDLIEGEPVPHGRIYPLSTPKQKAMEEYVEEALSQ